MNTKYLELARERMPGVPLLVNVVSQRVWQLNRGQRPMVKPDDPQMSNMDLAMKEIAEGKLTAEISYTAPLQTNQESIETM